MKKIEETVKRQVTFSKRRSSIMKKAEEIAVCCDVDVLFVAFSPSGRLSKFCTSQRRIEDVLQRYVNLPVERRLTHVADLQNLELQIRKSELELQIFDANIRDYEPAADQEPSLHQLNWCERNLQQSLQKVMARKMELEKQGMMDVQFAAQQTAPQQFDNWVNPYSYNSSIKGNICQDWMGKGKGIAGSSSNYACNAPFASSSQYENISFSQFQNPSPYIPLQNEQQNMVIDVQQNPAQTFGQPEEQVTTLGESSNNSIMNFWPDLCTSTRPMSSPLSTMGTQLNNPSQLGLEYANSNWNINLNDNNNNNQIIQHNVPPPVQSDARAPNVNVFNYSMEENTMGNNEYFADRTLDNDQWNWDYDFLNETFNWE
ncbi:hypothetical protein HAX54_010117 [Datura stramonium]|uniref:MADS-box domain-containing protein n=1 Tax=Datura stramonium TaxID=4076 RepID=A0ABS8THP4_DATST|nr:hypothetical protein [Datura stramonium]